MIIFLELQTTTFKWVFHKTTMSHPKICNHPFESTIDKMFQFAGKIVNSTQQYILFTSKIGEIIQFETNIFFRWVETPNSVLLQ